MNTVKMRDRNGGTDFMVRIPKFKLSDVLDGASDTVHPAFIVGGKEVDEIYISKYQNSIHNRLPYSLPYSLPFQKAATCISYADAVRACALKGKGWHLMSNAEWAAIALWCLKNGTLPHGNTQQGAYHADMDERGIVYDGGFCFTGSGNVGARSHGRRHFRPLRQRLGMGIRLAYQRWHLASDPE